MSTRRLPPVCHPVTAAVDVLRSTLNQLYAAAPDAPSAGRADTRCDPQLWRMGEAELLEARAALEAEVGRLTALRWALTREIDTRGAAVAAGATSTTAWLVHRLRHAPADAAREVKHAAAVTPETLPAMHAALVAGEITPAAAVLVADTDRQLAAYATLDERAEAEAILVGQARTLTVPQLQAAAARIRVLLDPDQGDRLASHEADQREAEHLRLHRHPDGSLDLSGYLGTEHAALLTTALAPLVRPRPATDQDGHLTRDDRSPAQRNADGMLDLVRRALAVGDLPDLAGQPAQLTVTIPLAALRSPQDGAPTTGPRSTGPSAADERLARCGLLDLGLPLSVAAVRRLACDAAVIPAVLGSRGEPLDVGRATRTIHPALRRALALRDGGCAFPGCDRPVGWCQVHHVRHWADGGPTALPNLVLLCGHHHRALHDDGWQVTVDIDQLPSFHPPPWVDPHRSPRRNHRLRPLVPD